MESCVFFPENCVLGYGFKGNNAEGGNCQQCLPGTYNDRTGSNKNLCKKCPAGKTNLAKGSTSCDYDGMNMSSLFDCSSKLKK